jgi:hypothetical protein
MMTLFGTIEFATLTLAAQTREVGDDDAIAQHLRVCNTNLIKPNLTHHTQSCSNSTPMIPICRI